MQGTIFTLHKTSKTRDDACGNIGNNCCKKGIQCPNGNKDLSGCIPHKAKAEVKVFGPFKKKKTVTRYYCDCPDTYYWDCSDELCKPCDAATCSTFTNTNDGKKYTKPTTIAHLNNTGCLGELCHTWGNDKIIPYMCPNNCSFLSGKQKKHFNTYGTYCGGCVNGDGCFINADCCDIYAEDGKPLPTPKKQTCQNGTCKPLPP